MSPRIAILGWGSLLWEGGNEFDLWHDQWSFDGPLVKLEFSRISRSRLGALTLVVDMEHGVTTTVAWCLSKRERAEDAVADLRCREGTETRNIRSIMVAGDPPEDESTKLIWAWAADRKLDVVVWTGLRSNFAAKVKRPFSIESAVDYLKGLPSAGKSKAAEYIWNAPEFVRTPLRSAMQAEPWFSKEMSRTPSS